MTPADLTRLHTALAAAPPDFLVNTEQALVVANATKAERAEVLVVAHDLARVKAPAPVFRMFLHGIASGGFRPETHQTSLNEEVWDSEEERPGRAQRMKHAIQSLRLAPPDRDMARSFCLNRGEYAEALNHCGLRDREPPLRLVKGEQAPQQVALDVDPFAEFD